MCSGHGGAWKSNALCECIISLVGLDVTTGDGGKVSVSLHGVRNLLCSIEALGMIVCGGTETGPGVKAGVMRLL